MGLMLRRMGFDDVLPYLDVSRKTFLDICLVQLKKVVEPGAIVVVYFAGHGEQDRQDRQHFLIGEDSDPSRRDTKIDLEEMLTCISNWQSKFLMVYLFMDCCRVNAGDEHVAHEVVTPEMCPKNFSPNQCYIVWACKKSCAAFGQECGDFTKELLEFLPRPLKMQDVYGLVYERLRKSERQLPTVQQEGNHVASLVLASDSNVMPQTQAETAQTGEAGAGTSQPGVDTSDEEDREQELLEELLKLRKKASANDDDVPEFLHRLLDVDNEIDLGPELVQAIEGHFTVSGEWTQQRLREELSQWQFETYSGLFFEPPAAARLRSLLVIRTVCDMFFAWAPKVCKILTFVGLVLKAFGHCFAYFQGPAHYCV